jgi:hypothetical protein
MKRPDEPRIDRSNWSLHEHCEYANAQLILKETNNYRRKIGAPPVRWVISGGRIAMEMK